MKYMGSKRRIAKHILPIMLDAANERGITTWLEPFVGGGNMIDRVPDSFERIGWDLNPHTIQAMIDIRDIAEELPEEFTAEQRQLYREGPPLPLTSWACIVTSFGADLKGGYAREKGSDNTTFCGYGKRNALKQQPKIKGVQFIHGDYREINPDSALIYCDPPYQNTSGYKTGDFDHAEFFEWCRMMAKRNLVFVSEYNAPDDFIKVWEGEQKTNFASTRKAATHNAVEKLFRVPE
jgi:DNA adenine methylase